MAERILATGAAREQIIAELHVYRERCFAYVKEQHPLEFFLPLDELLATARYSLLIDQPLFTKAMHLLTRQLNRYGPYDLLDPARVWVGVAMPDNETSFGGFYHQNQGYRYLQQIALVSLSGTLACHPVDGILATLELIRAYVHDTLHYNTYRLLCPLPQPEMMSFYRLQYGINFRKWNGVTYSAKDRVRSPTTRNLGNIMEAATDRFAHEFVFSLAQQICYPPPPLHSSDLNSDSAPDPLQYYVYRDCTGQLTLADIQQLRAAESGKQEMNTSKNITAYLTSMRLFVQYVNLRYEQFLMEFDPESRYRLHHLIIQSMLSGDMWELCHCFNKLQSSQRSFVHLFKHSTY